MFSGGRKKAMGNERNVVDNGILIGPFPRYQFSVDLLPRNPMGRYSPCFMFGNNLRATGACVPGDLLAESHCYQAQTME